MTAMKIKVYNQSGKETGTADLPDSVFALPWNADLVYQVVTSEMANRHRGIAHAKGRGEVRGGGRKPWRQKGTGRARHGSIRSPIWKGGGVTHGPTKDKNFKKRINKKMAKKALATVLSAKIRDKEVLIVDELRLKEPKTKTAVNILKHLSAAPGYAGIISKSVIIALPEYSKETIRSFRNISGVNLEEARNVTAFDLLQHQFLIMPKDSVTVLEKRLLSKIKQHV